MRYADQFAPKAIKMTLAAGEQTVKGISQMYMDCPSEKDKYDILCKLYGLMTIGSSVIFVKVCQRDCHGITVLGFLDLHWYLFAYCSYANLIAPRLDP